MGFWFFMLIMILLIPAVMIIFGKYFVKKAPENINYFFGYRTTLSMKSKETWEFAHNHIGNIWYKWGLILLPFSVLVLVVVMGNDEDTIGVVGTAITIVQLLPIFASIVITEKELKKNFDEEGNRKNGKSEK